MNKKTRSKMTRGERRNAKKKHTAQKSQEKDATVRSENSEHTLQNDQEEYVTQWYGYVSLTLALITSLACWAWLYVFASSFFRVTDVSREFEFFATIFGPFVMLGGGALCVVFGVVAFLTNHPPTRWLVLFVSLGPPVLFLGLFAYFAFLSLTELIGT